LADAIPVQPGDVIRYAYLWGYEDRQGKLEGRKDRPCAVMIVHPNKHIIGVCPITHTPPRDGQGVQVPAQTCTRLGLDDQSPCWIITTEMNQFVWPGPDIRKTPSGEHSHGLMPASLFKRVREQLLENYRKGLDVIFRPED